MKKLAVAIVMLAGLSLSGCSVFYQVQYEDSTKTIDECGLLGCTVHRASPRSGPYGLIPLMREVHINAEETPAQTK